MGTAVASWALLPKGGCSRGRRHQPLLPWPLGGHRQPCSSSSQTMRAIFSQCFNTSQLASVLGRSPPPPSPPRQQAAWPAPPAPRCCHPHHCLSHCFTTAPPNTPNTAILSEGNRQIRAQSKVLELTSEDPDIGNTAAPSNTHTFPQAQDWPGQCRGGWRGNPWTGRLPCNPHPPRIQLHCQAWETEHKSAPLAHFLSPFLAGVQRMSLSGTKDSGQELLHSRKRIIGRANARPSKHR